MSGFRYAYNQFVYYGEEVRTSIDRVARFGYDGIELADEPDAFDEAYVRRRVDAAGISVSSICSVYAAERDLAHRIRRASRGRRLRQTGRRFCRQRRCADDDRRSHCLYEAPAARLAGRRVGVGSRGNPRGRPVRRDGRREPHPRVLEPVRDLLPQPPRAGCRDGQGDRLPKLGVMGDTFHMNIQEQSIADAIRATGPLLNHVHPADSNPAAPGQGHPDFAPVLQSLADIGYAGCLSFELLPPSADPFGVMRAGGHGDFLDPFTAQAITNLKALEPGVRW